MSKFELSIIIPVYNVKKYIGVNLNRLLLGKKDNWEIIIVNDGSTDGSEKICEDIIKGRSDVRLFNKKNGGVSSARNLGIHHAQGMYILFIDGDDYVVENFAEVIGSVISYNVPFVFFKRQFIKRNCPEASYAHEINILTSINEFLFQVNDVEKMLCHKVFCSGSGEILLKKSLIDGLFFDINRSILEDYDFFFRVLDRTDKKNLFFCNKFLIYINDDVPNSLTKRKLALSDVQVEFVSETNPFLKKSKIVQKKVFWIENYFNLKRLLYVDRILYFVKNLRMYTIRFSLNKYMIGSLFYLVNVDINKLRWKVLNIKNNLRHK